MKTALVLAVLLCAALAAPTEDKEMPAVEAVEEGPQDEVVAAAEAVVEAPEEKMAAAAVLLSEEAAPVDARFRICPDGWFFHGSRCYMFVNSPMTWFSAEEHCNAFGSHLASASSPSEYIYLQQLTQSTGQSTAWMGGFYLQGRWLWIDRQGFYYTNWYSQSTATSYSCIYLRTTGGWANSACSSSYRFVCSKSPFGC